MTTADELEARIVALECWRHGIGRTGDEKKKNEEETKIIAAAPPPAVVVDESMRRARFAVETSSCVYSALWKWVPEPYYTWPLEQRAEFLGAPSIQHLCKSLLLENRKVVTTDENTTKDPTNPKFVLVIVQYAATLDVKKLVNVIRKLRTDVKRRLDESDFAFRLATTEDNDRLTGYTHNSVTPFGLLDHSIPMVIEENLRALKFFWMGGGHVHLKLGVAFSEFIQALNPTVANISEPRAMTNANMDDNEGLK